MSSSPCLHPILYAGLCASCGRDLSQQSKGRHEATSVEQLRGHAAAAMQRRRKAGVQESDQPAAAAAAEVETASSAASTEEEFSGGAAAQAIVLGGAHRTIHLSAAALREQSRRNSVHMMRSRRLLCVLDLDHTLLHATSDPRLAPFVGREEDLFTVQLPQPYPLPPKTHYVKLRPGLNSFLQQISRIADVHVYTMGVRPYADAVVQLIDPSHTIIQQRVVSRDETGGGAAVDAADGGHAASAQVAKR
jgi:hypothetical protein